MPADLGRRAVRQTPAVVEHRDAVAGRHHHVHVMLDQHDGHAASPGSPGSARRGGGFRRVETGGRLVEQQQLGLRHERAGDLDAAAACRAAASRPRPPRRAGDRRNRAPPGRNPRSTAPRTSASAYATARARARSGSGRACPTITFSSTLISRKSLRFWNVRRMPARARRSAGQRVMSLSWKRMRPARRRQVAGDQVEQGRLPRPVRPDQRRAPSRPAISMSTALTATRPPKCRDRPEIVRRADIIRPAPLLLPTVAPLP